MNFKGTFTTEKHATVSQLENILGISFKLYENTGSCYGFYNNHKIRLSNHMSKFVENGKGDFDFNYEAFPAEYIAAKITGANYFAAYKQGDYIKHRRQSVVGKCYFIEYNQEKEYIMVQNESGEIKKYYEEMFV